jgi:hypothetical protein
MKNHENTAHMAIEPETWPDFHFMIFQERSSSKANFWGFYAGFKGSRIW